MSDDRESASIVTDECRFQIGEIRKCFDSFYYFVDTYAHIQDRATYQDLPFKLWPGQVKALTLLVVSIFAVVLKARQLGLTWLVAAYVLWHAMFRSNALAIVISAKEDLAIEFLDRVKYIFDHLPEWMQPSVYKRNTAELSFGEAVKLPNGKMRINGLNSTIKSIPSTPDAGQSKTISLLVFDESALNQHCKEIWSAAKPTLEHANGQAIIISNPSKDKPGWAWTRKLCSDAFKRINDFKLLFLNWECVPGRGEGFLALQKKAGLDDDEISMQYPTTVLEALSTLGSSYFGDTITAFEGVDGTPGTLVRVGPDGSAIVGFRPEPRGILEIWKHPEPNWSNRYSVGSDIAEGLGGDWSVAYVYDRITNEYVARMRSNKIAADVWAQRLIDLGTYYHLPMIGVERDGAGITTVENLKDAYPSVYYRTKPGSIQGTIIKTYGWQEAGGHKQILVDELKRHFRDVFTTVPCAMLLDECSTFIRHDNGRLEHEDGAHDDCVIAAGIALQVSMSMGTPESTLKPDRLDMAARDWAVVTGELEPESEGEPYGGVFGDEDSYGEFDPESEFY